MDDPSHMCIRSIVHIAHRQNLILLEIAKFNFFYLYLQTGDPMNSSDRHPRAFTTGTSIGTGRTRPSDLR